MAKRRRYITSIPSRLLHGLLWLVALLPLPLLYLLSDLLFPVVYYLIRYRRRIVSNNLENAFPEKNKKERNVIARKFYRHFCDSLVEVVKLMNISFQTMEKRLEFRNREVIDNQLKQGRSVIVAIGHYGNWEWMNFFSQTTPFRMLAVYKDLSDPVFDDLFYRLRNQFGTIPVPMKQTLRYIKQYQEKGEPVITCLIADQCPVREELEYYTDFLNQDTPVFMGIERIARRYDHAVVFAAIRKSGRGRYLAEMMEVSDDPRSTGPYEITEKHVEMLEALVREKPEYWMWTHRRWKFSRKDMLRTNTGQTTAAD